MTKAKSISVYLDADQEECLKRAAYRAGVSISEFMRDNVLFAAGWHAYQGPLFAPGTTIVDRVPLTLALSLLRDAARLTHHTMRAWQEREVQAIPTGQTIETLTRLLRFVRSLPQLSELKYVSISHDMAHSLKRDAVTIQKIHPLLGEVVQQCADHVLEQLGVRLPKTTKEKNRDVRKRQDAERAERGSAGARVADAGVGGGAEAGTRRPSARRRLTAAERAARRD